MFACDSVSPDLTSIILHMHLSDRLCPLSARSRKAKPLPYIQVEREGPENTCLKECGLWDVCKEGQDTGKRTRRNSATFYCYTVGNEAERPYNTNSSSQILPSTSTTDFASSSAFPVLARSSFFHTLAPIDHKDQSAFPTQVFSPSRSCPSHVDVS